MTNKKGSALILVLIFMSILTILISIMLHNASLIVDCAQARLAAVQHTIALHALQEYAIAFCKEKEKIREKLSEKEREKPETISLTFDSWLNTHKKAHITITMQDKTYKIQCHLEQQQLSTVLKKEIDQWALAEDRGAT